MENNAISGIAQLQQVDLNIAKEFTSICDRFGLTYYMLGGTMLGAVRHKGFIPWDDDMDFGLPRNDYEKFLEIAPKELPPQMKLSGYWNNPNHQSYCARLFDIDTKVIEERIGNESRNTCVAIDIFPIDGTPNIGIIRKIYFFRVLFHRAMLSMCYKDSIDQKRKRDSGEKGLIFILEKLPIERITTPYKQKCKIDKIMRRQKIEGSKYWGNIMGCYRTKEVVPANFYGEGAFYQFEDTKFRGLKMYDEYLKWTYGDYMQLPSEKEIDSKEHFKIVEIHGEKIED